MREERENQDPLIYLAGLIALINNKANNRSANIRSLFLVYIVLFSWAGFTALIAKGFIVKTDIDNKRIDVIDAVNILEAS